MITGHTATGPAGTCDVCQAQLSHYEGYVQCPECEAVHCDKCSRAAQARRALEFDEDGAHWHARCMRCVVSTREAA